MPDEQSNSNDDESVYTQQEIAAEAASFGCASYDVAGIFREAGRSSMTEAEFRVALARWRGEQKREAQ